MWGGKDWTEAPVLDAGHGHSTGELSVYKKKQRNAVEMEYVCEALIVTLKVGEWSIMLQTKQV